MKAIMRLITTLVLLLTAWLLSQQNHSAPATVSVWTCGTVTWLMLELLLQNCGHLHSWMDESRATPRASHSHCAKARQRIAA